MYKVARIFTSSLCLLVVPFALMGCNAGSTWTAGRPDDAAYKNSGFGYEQSYYSIGNLDAMEQRFNRKGEKFGLVSHDDLIDAKLRFMRSRAIREYRLTEEARKYIINYRNTTASVKPLKTTTTYRPGEKPYFDKEDYATYTPEENTKIILRLKKVGKIPMTEITAKMMREFYKKHHLSTGEELERESYYRYTKSNPEATNYHFATYGATNDQDSTKNKESVLSSKTRLNAYLLDNMYEEGSSQ